MNSRTANAGKNAVMQSIATSLTIILGLVTRYFFNIILGEDYLGLSSLFATIIGVLSFADLGISNSFTYCLYKPIAEEDDDYITVLLYFFKRLMSIIMLIILIISVAVSPFLRYLAPGAELIDDFHLYFYYSLSVAEILAGYWCTFQVCYVAAKQQEYKLVPIRMFFSVAIGIIKILVLVITHSYALFVFVGAVITIIQQFVIRLYIHNKYPIVKLTKKGELREDDKKSLKRNTASALVLKFATISVYQTDAIIISMALKIGTLGRITNYTTIKDYVFRIISQIQNAAYASMGNVVATEKKEYQLEVFFKYLMVSEFLISLAGCALITLMSPFIILLFGEKWAVDELSITLMILAAVIVFHTYAANILPTVYGRFDICARYAFVEGGVNLVTSIVAINIFGLPGVYIGTVVSEIVYFMVQPKAIFKELFDGDKQFYKRSIKGILQTMFVVVFMHFYKNRFYNGTFCGFIVLTLITVLVWASTFWLLWGKDKYFGAILLMLKRFLNKISAKLNKKK